jgi:hypothetical protein
MEAGDKAYPCNEYLTILFLIDHTILHQIIGPNQESRPKGLQTNGNGRQRLS